MNEVIFMRLMFSRKQQISSVGTLQPIKIIGVPKEKKKRRIARICLHILI